MTRNRPLLRALLVALATSQVAAPSMAVMADARFARDAQWVGLHIEERRGERDHAPHLDDCAFCQFVAHFSGWPVSAGHRVQAVLARSPATPADAEVPRAGACPYLPDSRAPPRA